jgi:branched-chain amino acid aminotransferase
MSSEPAPRIDRLIWIDGRFVPWEQATVHVLSHSLQRGSLVFDYMSVHETPRGPAVFRLREHVERLLRSVQLVGLPLALGRAEIEAAVLETVRRNPGATAVKVSAYLPSIEVDVVPLDEHVSVAVAAYDPGRDIVAHKPARPHYAATLRLWIEKELRNRRPDILPAQAKVAANYTSPMAAKWRARRRGYDEILLVDEGGFVAEGPTSNVFLVTAGGTLVTPPEETVLLGITRLSVLEIARHDGIPTEVRRVRPEELTGAAEVFITGTTAGVWPAASVDDKGIGTGEPGPLTLRLRERLAAACSGRAPEFAAWLAYANEAGKG